MTQIQSNLQRFKQDLSRKLGEIFSDKDAEAVDAIASTLIKDFEALLAMEAPFDKEKKIHAVGEVTAPLMVHAEKYFGPKQGPQKKSFVIDCVNVLMAFYATQDSSEVDDGIPLTDSMLKSILNQGIEESYKILSQAKLV